MKGFKRKVIIVFALTILVVVSACSSNPRNSGEASDSTASDSTASTQQDTVIGTDKPVVVEKNEINVADTTENVLRKLNLDFEEYKKTVPSVTLDKQKTFIIQGDERMSEDDLFSYWLSFINPNKKSLNVDTSAFLLNADKIIVGTSITGAWLTWDPGTTLKFSIIRSTFPNSQIYQETKADFLTACRDWEGLCNIKFQYHPEKDFQPQSVIPPAGITFTVEYSNLASGDDPNALAISFYKNEIRSRKIRVFPAFFQNRSVSPPGVLRHEVGHVLGFRHEHISPDAPSDCPRTEHIGIVVPQTDYDHNSIMHYLCGSFDNTKMIFTSRDTLGAQKVYGRP